MTNNFNNQTESLKATPKLTPEEWKQKKKAERDIVFKMIDDASKEVATNPESLKGYLDTQSQMDRYSATNALLIYYQFPKATQIKDFNEWAEKKVSITRGAKSFSIIEPTEYVKNDGSTGLSYNVKKVFDVSQTNSKANQTQAYNNDPRKVSAAMIDTSPVNVEMTDEMPYENMGAFFDSEAETLYIKKDIGDSVALCQCLAQELAHAQLSIDNEDYSRKKMGFKATCIGYMLCKKNGIDAEIFKIKTIPDEYRAMNPKEIRKELSSIRNSMSTINSRVSEELYRRKEQRNKEYER